MATIGPTNVKVDGNNVGTEGSIDFIGGTNVTLTGGNTPGVKNSVTINASSSGGVVVGAVFQYIGSSAPSGYLLCDGSAVSRTTYSALFAICGTSYGAGDGATTFNLPDFRGRVPVGKGTNTDVDTLGESDGSALADRRPKHKHTSATTSSSGSHSHDASTSSDGSHTHSDNSTTAGGSGAYGGDFTILDSTGGTTGSGGTHSHSVNVTSAGSHTHGNSWACCKRSY